jgi:phosphoglycerate dehydrogenase-like enzyme
MRVALLDDYFAVSLELADWQRLGADVQVEAVREHIAGIDELAARLAPYDCLVLMRERTKFPRTLIERLPNLRLLVTAGMWNASVDIDACTERGIQVCGTRDLGHLTAELTMGLLISLARNIVHEDRTLRVGRWETKIGTSLRGKTLGILGLGKLGTQVCGFARTFGMQMIAWSQNLTSDVAQAAGATLVSKGELFAKSDYVTIHARLSPRTRDLVGAAELSRMKATSYLINTSRGPIVNEAALIDALRSKVIAGAALDVFDTEPLAADHPLRMLDNTILLPHLGYVTEENFRVIYGDALDDVETFLAGDTVRPLNNPRRSS